MHLWLGYVWCFTVMIVLSAVGRSVLRFKRPDVVSRFDVTEGLLSLVAIPALFGFVHQQPIGSRWFWIVVASIFLVLSVWQFASSKMRQLYRKGWLLVVASIAGMIVLGGPALYALMDYAFFEPQLWR